MSRFFSYEELAAKEPAPPEDLLWLATEIEKLPPFGEGAAVLCGSAAWGRVTSRSDIDVAHFATQEFPKVSVGSVLANYAKLTNNRFILPRVDVVTVGAESTKYEDIRVFGEYGTETKRQRRTVREVFDDVSLRFADHVGALAQAKDGPWRVFLQRYLAKVTPDRNKRRANARAYTARVSSDWASQPLHRLTLGTNPQAASEELASAGILENFATHLLRRLLAHDGCYPSPDRTADILAAAQAHKELWSLLGEAVEPFLSVDERYSAIIAAVRRSERPIGADEYYEQIRLLVRDLPVADLEEKVWKYLADAEAQDARVENERLEAIKAIKEAEDRRKQEELRAEEELKREEKRAKAESQRLMDEIKRRQSLEEERLARDLEYKRKEARQAIDDEAYRSRQLFKSRLPRWLRWMW